MIRYSSIAGDGGGGAIVAWTDMGAGPSAGDIRLQRVDGGGIAAGWPNGGMVVCAADDDQSLPTIASDGAAGVFVAWQDRRSAADYDVYAHHIGSILAPTGRRCWAGPTTGTRFPLPQEISFPRW